MKTGYPLGPEILPQGRPQRFEATQLGFRRQGEAIMVGTETDIERGWLSTEEVAERLAVPVEVVARWMRTGRESPTGELIRLKAIWIGHYRAIREVWVADFLAKTSRQQE